jgi:hypothetical protein
VGAVDSSEKSARRFSVIVLVIAANCAAACHLSRSDSARIPAAFWFDGVTPASVTVVSERLSAPLTSAELLVIESDARRELQLAFEHTRLQFTDTPSPAFRVRVVPQPEHGRSFPAAGESRAFGGIRGNGTVNFNVVALGALAYADASSNRQTLIRAIGRGVGRTAVHEFAHQILGPAGMDGTADPLTYEHGDLRAEHFYAPLHWGPAAARLQQRIGLRQSR